MKHSNKGQVFTDIVLEIFKLSGLLVAEGDELTKSLGLSSARWKVLGALAQSDQPMTVPQIAHTMGQTRQSVQRLTDAMAQAGILSYQNNPYHKKAKWVTLTRQGQKIFQLLEQQQIPWANNSAAGISSADMKITLSVLQQMTQYFENKRQ